MTLPDFPKLISGFPSERLELQAKPDNSLTVHFNPTMNLTIQPKELTIQHPSSKAEFQVGGNMPGVGVVSYELKGASKHDFVLPDKSFVFIGHNISSQKSIYTRLGLLTGELPIGCQKEELKNNPPCYIRMAFDSNSTMSSSIVIESGPVHIITPDNQTIPLSLAGYNFSSPHPSRKQIMERLIRRMYMKKDDQNPGYQGCAVVKLTAGDLIEFVQKDALPKSFMKYLTKQLPLWLRVVVRDDNDLFDVENTLAYLVQTTDVHNFNPDCKFPMSNQSNVVLYRPTVKYNISIENDQLSVSSKGSCFAIDICESGVFLALTLKASNKFRTMPFMKDMADGGWDFLVSSVGFTTPRRYNRIVAHVPDGHLAENFSDFHYNLWWRGSANIHLNNSSSNAVNMKITGEAFVFAKDLNAVSINHLFKVSLLSQSEVKIVNFPAICFFFQ